MDYGHPLQFGAFITPVNAPPTRAVELAVLSEQLGFDLVTFQDHPYQPGFLDAWTLMTWVAAQTTRIHIAPNVLNLPMRPPAVLARSAASLDLLSGGRFDLGLGAGAFWDPMVAMGATRLTAGESVDALSEAMDVIRALWAVADRVPLKYDGAHYQLHGAKRGPAPAHEIPLWLGALKPRMLRLIGEKGDGWLPSLMYLEPGQLQRGMAVIDAAAAESDRDPREIRRLLNIAGRLTASGDGSMLVGPSAQWVEQLVPLALEDGVSTFVLASDDPTVLSRFAEEVAPAVREAVARERSSGGVVEGTLRSSIVRAKRRENIDYDGIPVALRDGAIEPGDPGYAAVKSTYLRGGAPGLVLQVRDAGQVAEALTFAKRQAVSLATRSGGHGISGRSTNNGGIVIDLSKMDAIEVIDVRNRMVRIQPGARWSEVAAALAEHGWALSSGDYGGVGVGGLATAGGVGWLVREHGLTIDHLRAVEMVLADGTFVRADATENADLFWGVRGAGANFGIVTAFEFEVDEIGEVGFALFVHDATDAASLLERWGSAVETAPRDTTSFLMMGPARRGQPAMAQVMTVVDSDVPETVIDRLQALAEVAPLLDQTAQILPYAAIMNAPPSEHHGQGEPVARSGLIDHLTPAFAAAAQRLMDSGAVYLLSIRAVGGAVADVDPQATAYANRSANFSVTVMGGVRTDVDREWDQLLGHFDGLYLNFETDLRPERLADAYPAQTLARLRELKHRYDPDNVFRDNFNVAPSVLQTTDTY